MSKRGRMSRGISRKVFKHGARNIHPRNIPSNPMRGGIRL